MDIEHADIDDGAAADRETGLGDPRLLAEDADQQWSYRTAAARPAMKEMGPPNRRALSLCELGSSMCRQFPGNLNLATEIGKPLGNPQNRAPTPRHPCRTRLCCHLNHRQLRRAHGCSDSQQKPNN